MGNTTCNCEKFKAGALMECGKNGVWEHPRWSGGVFCEECRENILVFFPMAWIRIKEDKDGK